MSEFEASRAKDKENRHKHGISLDSGRFVFDGLYFETIDRRRDYGETRLVAVGPAVGSVGDKLMSVTYTWRESRRRLRGKPVATNEDDIIIVTRAMSDAALIELNELIRSGKWPKPDEGDDQLDVDNEDLRAQFKDLAAE